VIEVHDSAWPKPGVQGFPGYQLSGFFQQYGQQAKWLFLQPDAPAILCQAAGSKIRFEDGEPQTPERVVGSLHTNPATTDAAAVCGSDCGIIFRKILIQLIYPGDPQFSQKVAAVH